jgi:hypothetical protein
MSSLVTVVIDEGLERGKLIKILKQHKAKLNGLLRMQLDESERDVYTKQLMAVQSRLWAAESDVRRTRYNKYRTHR